MENFYRLEVESVDLGPDVRAVALELIKPERREPVTGTEAASIWATLVPALAVAEPWAIDFFAHLERVRDFCRRQAIAFREPNSRAIVIPKPEQTQVQPLFERFAGETFGVRAGAPLVAGDASVEGALAERGVDAYHAAFPRYLFCCVCDFAGGFLTVLSNQLWASEVIRRARGALGKLPVEVTRPA
ncbi:MAG TPA: hypothetical protein VKL99_07690 [Candidatus Angelobacter sp.]|nr:hypothetical protein [Candidatus Angelobacter sp.]